MPSLRLISLIIGLVLLLLAMLGVDFHLGTFHPVVGWGGLFFCWLSTLPGSSPRST